MPVAPTRLERRRVLDAAGAGLALEAIPDAQPFVQTAALTTAEESADHQDMPAAMHGGPHATIRLRDAELFEDQSTLAVISIADNFPMAHEVTIDWGDGSPATVINAGVNQREVLAVHRFLDDPAGPGDGSFTISVTVKNTLGEEGMTSANILVKNVAPKLNSLAINSPIDENGTATITGTYSDVGSVDTHTLDIDWDGDGTFDESVAVSGGTFSVSRQYLDDPSGSSSDTFHVNVRLRDDDGGEASGAVPLTVKNVAPTFTNIAITSPIVENGTATLSGTYVDAGAQDTHSLDIDWDGDGTFDQTVAVSGDSFSVSRQFLDDNPTGVSDTSNVNVRLRDDDGGEALASVELTVENANPIVMLEPGVISIFENGTAVLNGTYTDAGTLDTHELDIDWDGNGTFDQTVAVTGGAFTVTRQFLDDNPSGTRFDKSTITVRLRDDDGGVGTASKGLQVNNLSPVVTLVPPTAIDENGIAVLDGTISDIGTQDTFTLAVVWGDPASLEDLQFFSLGATPLNKAAHGINWDPATRQFSIDHRYLDDNPSGTPSNVYTIQVAVADDDGGTDVASTMVTVHNADPILTVAANQTVDEGAVLDLSSGQLGSFTDVGTRDTHTAKVDWGDGSGVQAVSVAETNGSGTLSASHVYADDGVYIVTVTVTDDDLGTVAKTFEVTVQNVNPVLDVADDQTIDEGAALDLTSGLLGTFTDQGIRDTQTATVNWGDGSGDQTVAVSQGSGTGSLSAQHTYADNGLYTVTVTVTDDDGGRDTKTFQVTVSNVDPTLTGVDGPISVEEGQIVTLSSLGVGLQDPGFDNIRGGTEETLEALSIDWGDGSTTEPIGIDEEFNGSPGTPTTATFEEIEHAYADDGSYTVTIRVRDDDGGFVERMFTIVVNNKNPTLDFSVDLLEIKEGEDINLSGMFTDAGFDNANNPNGPSREIIGYTIDWGDGKESENDDVTPTVFGGPGVPTSGSFTVNHVYADNDADNIYTIKVTMFDDDGGSVTKEIDIRVLNVNPTLEPLTATDVTTRGIATVTVTFDDPGADNFIVHIDWGDNEPDAIEFRYDDITLPFTHTFEHQYDGPPDPLNPSADIIISVFVTDDDFGTLGVEDIGLSITQTVQISNPGIGAEPFRIDTTPRVPQLTFPVREVPLVVPNTAGAAFTAQQTFIIGGSSGEAPAAAYRYFELRVIDAEGNESEGYPLPANVLEDLPGLFRTLPDNHYAIYVVNSETNVSRLVIEVYVRNGKMIDPGDDSEGTRDRPPTDEQGSGPAKAVPTEDAPVGMPAAGEASVGDQVVVPAGVRGTRFSRWSALAVGLAASASAQSWAQRVDEALAKATAEQWRKLQGHKPSKPKNP